MFTMHGSAVRGTFLYVITIPFIGVLRQIPCGWAMIIIVTCINEQ